MSPTCFLRAGFRPQQHLAVWCLPLTCIITQNSVLFPILRLGKPPPIETLGVTHGSLFRTLFVFALIGLRSRISLYRAPLLDNQSWAHIICNMICVFHMYTWTHILCDTHTFLHIMCVSYVYTDSFYECFICIHEHILYTIPTRYYILFYITTCNSCSM